MVSIRRLSIDYIIVHAYYMSVRQALYNFVFGVLIIVVIIFKGYIFILSGYQSCFVRNLLTANYKLSIKY